MSNEIKLPDLGEGVLEGEITKIKVSPGDTISPDQPLLEVMTDKASMEIPSSRTGIIKEVKAKPGDMVEVGQTLFILESSSQDSSSLQFKTPPLKKTEKKPAVAVNTNNPSSIPEKTNFPLSAPATRKLAAELGIPLDQVTGTGQKAQILREDLIEHIKVAMSSLQPTNSQTKPSMEVAFSKEDRREPLLGIKRIMFETMTYSHQNMPHFTILEKAPVTQLVKLREEFKVRLEKQNLKITYLPFIMKALVSCLREFPILNSVYDEKTKEIVYRKSFNLGFAADTPQGLLVPVIHEAQDKSLLELAESIQALGQQARSGEITRDKLQNGTLTLTNLGSVGGIYGFPIINPPQVAILGIYRLYRQLEKTKEGDFKDFPYMNFSLTCDHRLIDGATAARFLKSLVLRIEDPSLLMLEN